MQIFTCTAGFWTSSRRGAQVLIDLSRHGLLAIFIQISGEQADSVHAHSWWWVLHVPSWWWARYDGDQGDSVHVPSWWWAKLQCACTPSSIQWARCLCACDEQGVSVHVPAVQQVRWLRVCPQFGNRLDDLLELVCSDVVGTTVEEVEEALHVLQEKSDACGQYKKLSFLQSTKCIYSWVPVVSTNSFPYFSRVQNVSTAGCLWSVPTTFLTSVRVQNVSTAGCLWSVPPAFLSSEYKMYPQLGACGQYLSSVRVQNVSTARLPDQIVMETMWFRVLEVPFYFFPFSSPSAFVLRWPCAVDRR